MTSASWTKKTFQKEGTSLFGKPSCSKDQKMPEVENSEQICQCGKKFETLWLWNLHMRSCSSGKLEGAEENLDGPQAVAIGGTSSSASPDKAAKELSPDERPPLISYRCVQCQTMFATVQLYQQHYLGEHIHGYQQRAIDHQHCDTGAVTSNAAADNQDDHEESAQSQAPRSSRKSRCARILSSSSEDDTPTTPPKKLKPVKTNEDASVSSTTDAVAPKPKQDRLVIFDSAAPASSDTDDSRLESHQPKSSENATSLTTDNLELVKDLLKDADAVSKPEKVIILNFFSGRRVNPRPDKGAVSIIRLGEKSDVVTLEDGSKQTVMRESYVKLNYETGQWETIEKKKQLQAGTSTGL